RRNGEEGDTGQEQAPVPEEVAEPAPKQEEASEGDQIRVDNPRKRLLRETQIRADRRESNAHDCHVQNDHQVPKAQDEESEPAPVADGSPAWRLIARVLDFSLWPGRHRFLASSLVSLTVLPRGDTSVVRRRYWSSSRRSASGRACALPHGRGA